MGNAISYKPGVRKQKLDKAVAQFNFDNSKQLLDFLVDALVSKQSAKIHKLVVELASTVHKAKPLGFTKPTAQEDKEICHRYAEMKKGKSFTMHPLK